MPHLAQLHLPLTGPVLCPGGLVVGLLSQLVGLVGLVLSRLRPLLRLVGLVLRLLGLILCPVGFVLGLLRLVLRLNGLLAGLLSLLIGLVRLTLRHIRLMLDLTRLLLCLTSQILCLLGGLTSALRFQARVFDLHSEHFDIPETRHVLAPGFGCLLCHLDFPYLGGYVVSAASMELGPENHHSTVDPHAKHWKYSRNN
ncbi:hypothetical protein [Nocardia arthritidis]|uniref:Uncharacterized protein n=1 Tax=Nocardia arthritidis TaxID=228602 RepID=A0A6G9YH76_9NOCA|nr:hypothetical protein [Nocardia arthritidis]QIS12500.1 hypothetical protein F5544_23200 [Nocardia arthritidis]